MQKSGNVHGNGLRIVSVAIVIWAILDNAYLSFKMKISLNWHNDSRPDFLIIAQNTWSQYEIRLNRTQFDAPDGISHIRYVSWNHIS